MPKHRRIFPLSRHFLFAALSLLLAASAPAARNLAAQERGQGVKRPAEAKPEQRLALVIGNADYKEARLVNPVNDARDMTAALRAVGFEVLSGEDRNQRQMKDMIRQFGQKLRNGGVGVFYFAGHGVQVGGRNYLIPIGAEINSEAEVEYEAVEAGFVLAQMEEARNRLNVVILDACRNNPYARSFRSGSRGLAGVRKAPSGTLIAYATAADDVANDGSGRNGLFTGELLTQLKTPGLTLAQVFQRTRTSVFDKSSGKQEPYDYSSVRGEDFYFIPLNAPPPAISAEQQAWERVKQRRTPDAVRGFLNVYPDSPFEKEARALLAVLEKENLSPVSAPARAEAERPNKSAEDAKRERDATYQKLYVSLSEILDTKRETRGFIVNLGDVLFDTGKATLKPAAREKLSKLAGILLAYPGTLTLEIEGYTDSVGSDQLNNKFSQDRAEAISSYLVSSGIKQEKIKAVRGFGKTRPIATNGTAAGRQQNRRVEVVIEDTAAQKSN